MQQLLPSVAVLGACAALVTTATAGAAPATKTVDGKLVSVTYAAAKQTGTVTVSSAKGRYVYLVDKATDCGYSQGQMGDSIVCKALAGARFKGKPVTVKYHRNAAGKRVAELVAAHL